MNAEIITIGDELLMGQTIDTNSVYIAKKLETIGIRIHYKTAISDSIEAINQTLELALKRSELIILTGGLGPTKDDITKKTLANFFQSGWRTDQTVIDHLKKIFERRGRTLLDSNLLQAELPEKCITLFNQAGTAPGMWFDHDQKIIISLPGVPNEVEYLIENQVIPRLNTQFNLPQLVHKTLVTLMVPESLLSKQLEAFEASLPSEISLAYLPSFNCVKLRLSAKIGQTVSEDVLTSWFEKLQLEAAPHVLCTTDSLPCHYIAQRLLNENITFSLAESCTGGYISNQMVQVPGISAVFEGSMVSYSYRIKHEKLGVSNEILNSVGAVSEECAVAMAKGIRDFSSAQLGIGVTGIAGPGGGSSDKPVGTVYIAVSFKNHVIVRRFNLPGTRIQFMERTANCAMALVNEILEK